MDKYEKEKEVDMPAKYQDNKWVDSVIEEPAWKAKEAMMQAFCKDIEPIVRLNAKTRTYMFVELMKKMYQQSMVMLKIDVSRMFELLAERLRKNMKQEAKQTLPIMLVDLKIKNKQLKDQIFKTIEKYFLCMSLDDMMEDFKENLVGKNVEKTAHILDIFILMIKNSVLLDDKANGIKLTKVVKPHIDSSDSKVRETASQIIALLLDKYSDSIKPLLSDLNNVKMNKIYKFCKNPENKVDISEPVKVEEGQSAPQDKPQKQQPVDKSSKIKQMRENLFSNNQVKITDLGAFSKYLEQNLKILADMTKDFKELNVSQAKEIYELITEIAQKVQKQSLVQQSRE